MVLCVILVVNYLRKNETIGYQVEVESTRMLDGEKISEWDVVFIPFK